MKNRIRRPILARAGAAAFVLAAAGLLWLYGWMPGMVMRSLNTTLRPGPYAVTPEAKALHDTLFVADLHCDALMWPRDLTRRGVDGHVDIPRMLDGNVALQLFFAVNRAPGKFKPDRNTPGLDTLGVYNFFQGWPAATWYSPKARALHMAGRLEKAVQQSNGVLQIIRTREDLERFSARRAAGERIAAAILGVEGLNCLEDDLENTRVLYHAGYRVLGLTHFLDNAIAGAAQGLGKGGLTPFGRNVLQFMERLKMLPDLAHLSEKAIDDVLSLATRPLLVSHTGLRGICAGLRNLTDEQARRIAEHGGLIGIGFWEDAVGEPDVGHIVQSIQYAVNLLGIEHVALGSDFDGSVAAPFDAAGMPLLTEGLLRAGFSAQDIPKIMGGNAQRLFLEALPEEGATDHPDR